MMLECKGPGGRTTVTELQAAALAVACSICDGETGMEEDMQNKRGALNQENDRGNMNVSNEYDNKIGATSFWAELLHLATVAVTTIANIVAKIVVR